MFWLIISLNCLTISLVKITFYPFWGFYSEQSSLVIKSSLKHVNLCHLRFPYAVLVPAAPAVAWSQSLLAGPGHTVSLHPRGSLATARVHLSPSATERWGERSAWDSISFFPTLCLPPESCLLNCWKWSATHRVTLKKFLSACNHKDGHLSPIFVVFYERERKIYVTSKLELCLEKPLKKIIDLQCHFVSQTKDVG